MVCSCGRWLWCFGTSGALAAPSRVVSRRFWRLRALRVGAYCQAGARVLRAVGAALAWCWCGVDVLLVRSCTRTPLLRLLRFVEGSSGWRCRSLSWALRLSASLLALLPVCGRVQVPGSAARGLQPGSRWLRCAPGGRMTFVLRCVRPVSPRRRLCWPFAVRLQHLRCGTCVAVVCCPECRCRHTVAPGRSSTGVALARCSCGGGVARVLLRGFRRRHL